MPEFKSEKELLSYAKRLEGKKISEINKMISRLDNEYRMYTKGVVAQVIEKDYFGDYSALSDEASLLEGYVGVRLWDKQENKRVDAIVPVLDSGLNQREILAPLSEIARFKLFPDLSYTDSLVCINDLYRETACLEDYADNPADLV